MVSGDLQLSCLFFLEIYSVDAVWSLTSAIVISIVICLVSICPLFQILLPVTSSLSSKQEENKSGEYNPLHVRFCRAQSICLLRLYCLLLEAVVMREGSIWCRGDPRKCLKQSVQLSINVYTYLFRCLLHCFYVLKIKNKNYFHFHN